MHIGTEADSKHSREHHTMKLGEHKVTEGNIIHLILDELQLSCASQCSPVVLYCKQLMLCIIGAWSHRMSMLGADVTSGRFTRCCSFV